MIAIRIMAIPYPAAVRMPSNVFFSSPYSIVASFLYDGAIGRDEPLTTVPLKWISSCRPPVFIPNVDPSSFDMKMSVKFPLNVSFSTWWKKYVVMSLLSIPYPSVISRFCMLLILSEVFDGICPERKYEYLLGMER